MPRPAPTWRSGCWIPPVRRPRSRISPFWGEAWRAGEPLVDGSLGPVRDDPQPPSFDRSGTDQGIVGEQAHRVSVGTDRCEEVPVGFPRIQESADSVVREVPEPARCSFDAFD